MDKKIYKIPEQNLEDLKARIEKLNKKCRKLAVPEIVLSVGEPVDQEINLKVVRSYPVTIEGTGPKLNGWQFIAVLDHIPDAGTIVRALPGEQIGVAYRDAKPNCDHCQENRRRKDTYLVRSEETGDIKQVGSSCLKDFLGHASPESLAALAEMLATTNTLCEEFERRDFSDRYRIPLFHYLTYVAKEIQNHGWVSRKVAREQEQASTSDYALTAMYDANPTTPPDEKAVELAKGAMEWAESLQEKPTDELGDYEYNLMIVFKTTAIEPRSCGLAASAVYCHIRNLEKEAKLKADRAGTANSKHIGTVEKREVFTLTILSEKLIEGQYGVTHLYRMQDEHGNIVVWFSSRNCSLEVGKTYQIKGTVKKHDVFNGTNQTMLTRCTVEK